MNCPLDRGALPSWEKRGASGGHGTYSKRFLSALTVHVRAPGALAMAMDTPFLKGSVFEDGMVRIIWDGNDIEGIVKNGFSDPTKVKIGRDWPRQDVGCECQGKALKEGCREREAARKSVSSTEKINTKENLARATAKPRAGCRQSLQDVSVGFRGNRGQTSVSTLETT